MIAWCDNCNELKESTFRPAKDYCTGLGYEDICCNECHFVIATIGDREDSNTSDQLRAAKVAVLREAAEDLAPGKQAALYPEAYLCRRADEIEKGE